MFSDKKVIMDGETADSAILTSIVTSELKEVNPLKDVDLNATFPVDKSSELEESSPYVREVRPLVSRENMEGGTDHEEKDENLSCWKCKYNWRYFLPVACCCRR